MDEFDNSTLQDEDIQQNWVFAVLAIIPLSCVVGNSLVIAAVWSTKSLQTSTNYLLVSLACADLLIGLFVMPLNIYISINALHWHLSAQLCYIYCLLDVSASTCSIAHLVLISIDRLVAATKPAEYKTQKHKRRVHIAIISTWIFSICISLPLVTGFNTSTRRVLQQQHHCGIYSPVYMLCSSIFAFYMPCLIMSITYGYIFHTLRRRLRAIQLQEMAGGQFLGFGADVGNIATSAIETVIGVEAKNRNMITWEKPLLRKIEETAAEHASSLNDSEREQLQTILEAVHPSCSSSQYELTATFIEADDISDRPSSVVLEAVTLRNNPSCCYSTNTSTNNNNNTAGSQYGGSSLALEVPKSLPRRLPTRRFSDAIQSNLRSRLSCKMNMESPTEECNERGSVRPNISWGDLNDGNNNISQSLTARPQQPAAEFARRAARKSGAMKTRKTTIRRHSYQPPGMRLPDENGDEFGTGKANFLKPNLRDKTMRRLSDIISEWERPSRASLGQMYSFARRESVYIARKKLAGLKDWALDLLAKLKSKQGMAIRRETRATKLVATVMGVFLICWMPFFTLNMVKVYRLMHGDWPSDLEFLFHWTSALGYLNSSLNFVIYSAINKKFRSSFRRLVGLNSNRKRKSWMLPPREMANANGQYRRRHHHCRHHHRTGKVGSQPSNRCDNRHHAAQTAVQEGKLRTPPTSEEPREPGKNSATDESGNAKADPDASGGALAAHLGDGPSAFGGVCGCINTPFNPARSSRSSKSGKSGRSNSSNPLSLITRRFSVRKPEIIIDEVSVASEENLSISAGGKTTYRHSSDDCIRRSSSEMIGGGMTYPSNRHHESRRDSGMSNSSASLQLHDMHQIADQSSREAEIFV